MTANQPSVQSIANATEVLELASLLDHRVPTPDKARILAWARQIDRHLLDRDDMLDSVQAFYDKPTAQPLSVGDVITTARLIKRDRLDREADEERERRQETHDAKAAEMELFTDAIGAGPTLNRTSRLTAAEKGLQTCTTKHEAQEAIREYFAAKRQAQGRPA